MTEPDDFAGRWRAAQGFEATRDVLRDAAHDIICTRGLDDLNMRGLAARVGASAMATYRYYPGKETLIEDVRLHVSNEFASVLQEAAARAGDPVARFRYMCLAYIDFAVSNEQDYRLMFGTVAQPTSVTGNAARRAPAWEALLQVLEELPHPECPASIADQAHLVWSNLHGLAMLHLSKRLNFGRSIRDLADPLFTFLLRALCVPAAADAHRRPDPAA